MAKDIVPHDNLIIDNECMRLLYKHFCNRIIERETNRENAELSIYLNKSNHLNIKYNHHFYKVTIIKKDDKCYWYLQPYHKSYFIYPAKDRNSFDVVIQTIKEHDNLKQ